MAHPSASDEELLGVFKALADANRLKIIGLLASEPRTVEQLAALLKLSPSTVSHHLSRLAEAGLVSARAESYYNFYRLEEGALEGAAHSLLGRKTLSDAPLVEAEAGAYERKVLRDLSQPDGRLKAIPAQRKKRQIVLRHIVQYFEHGRRYPESEVVEILRRFHDDTATLRREMIGYHLLERQDGLYWRPEERRKE